MSHRAHDYRNLIGRWRAVARIAGLRLRRLVRADGYEHFYLQTPSLAEGGGLYISAGIHGDEAAATEGLVTWAEKYASQLTQWPLFVLPCLNPWGLMRNIRSNAAGLDLNRSFHRDDVALIRAVREVVGARQFAASLMLHEDYDGQGVYLYEIQRVEPYWGEALLTAARVHLPTDSRERIDGRKVSRGIYRRRMDWKRFHQIGYPEAIWLHQKHSKRTFTVETPSEFALSHRVAAQVAMLEETVRRVVDESV